jgi:hypothetical protein
MADYARATQRYTIHPGSFAHYALGTGAILNLSLSGVFIEDRSSRFETGQELELELRLQDEVVTVHGRVCHSRPGVGFGVYFARLPEESKQQLVTYFRTHVGRPPERR